MKLNESTFFLLTLTSIASWHCLLFVQALMHAVCVVCCKYSGGPSLENTTQMDKIVIMDTRKTEKGTKEPFIKDVGIF